MIIQNTTNIQKTPAFKQKFIVSGEDMWKTREYAEVLKDYLFA